MTQSFSNEIPSPKNTFTCECYKKLQSFGIPLLISDENDLYGENGKITPRENVFQLPGILKMNESIRKLPVIAGNELSYIFERMAEIFPNLWDFEQNVVSFWILDVMIEGLWTAQNAKMEQNHQRATLLWIAYFFNYIQMHNPSRKDLFFHLKSVLFRPEFPGESVGEPDEKSGEVEEKGHEGEIPSESVWELPLPPEISPLDTDSALGEQSSNGNTTEEEDKNLFSIENDSKLEGNYTEINVKHMKIILEILYRIFARLWVFMELQTVFSDMPSVETVDLPFDLKAPKPLHRPESAALSKAEKGGKRLSRSEKSLEDIENKRQLHKNDYILPLQEAEESKTYLKYMFGQQTSDRSMPKKKN